MKKKNLVTKLGVAVLVLTLITTSLVSGTLAKYTDTAKMEGTAIAAAWKFDAKSDGEQLGSTAYEFDLDEFLSNTILNPDAVASGRVAPGMEGVIPVSVDMRGTEVDTNLSIVMGLEEGSLPSGLKFFSVKKGATASEISDAKAGAKQPSGAQDTGLFTVLEKTFTPTQLAAAAVEYDIHWFWEYYESATADNADKTYAARSEANRTATLSFTITATQVNPKVAS